jgi:type IX secretion system PorP/SprF family membrane protein
MKRSGLYVIIFMCINYSDMICQDVLFSQHYNNMLYSNAASTGVFYGKYRAGAAYRNQYFGISQDSRITLKDIFFDARINTFNNDYFSFGAVVTDENYGTARLGKTVGYLCLSYSKILNFDKYRARTQSIVIGTQVGYGKFYHDDGGYLFGIQFDKSSQTLDRHIQNGETLVGNKSFPDMNLGLLYFLTGKTNSVYFGISGSHINRPDISLLARSSKKMDMRVSALSGGQISLTGKLQFLPSMVISMQSGIYSAIFGTQIQVKYNNTNESNAMKVGAFIRSTNSFDKSIVSDVIISSSFEQKKLTLGISYDVNISSIRKITGMNGAFELTGIYIWGDNPLKKLLNCPTF